MITIYCLLAGVTVLMLLSCVSHQHAQEQQPYTSEEGLQRIRDIVEQSLQQQPALRDIESGLHLERVTIFVEMLALELCSSSSYSASVDQDFVENLVRSAPLHDVGKAGIPAGILNKPGRLTEKEFELMKSHSENGAQLIREHMNEPAYGSFLSTAVEVAASHHERWDGHGYPEGLVGDDIPLSARIVALADVYDALRSELCYKKAFSHPESMKIIVNQKGRQFDPHVVDAFVALEKEFEKISTDLAD